MRTLILITSLLVSACGASAAREPQAPPPAAPGPTSAAPPPAGRAERLPAPASVPPPPEICRAYVDRAAGAACPPAEKLDAALDAALTQGRDAQDGALQALEACETLPAGLIRALRADLAPRECADALTQPLLQAPPAGLKADVQSALAGLALAAKLARLVHDAPRLDPPFDKSRFVDFFRNTFGPWILSQARAIHDLSLKGSTLVGYGKGVVAVEAGLADMRFVEISRNIPLPEDMAENADVKDAYYAALDEALEPRKERGRDAALVGLREMADEGVLDDARVERARALLSQLYAGRRIDALDGLLLSPLPKLEARTVEQRLAAKLPTFYAGYLLSDVDPKDPALLRALLERGIPRGMRAHLDSAQLSPNARELYARALVTLGQRYWRSRDFQRAARVAVAPGDKKPPERARLVAALARALEGGPVDAAHMMLKGPLLPSGVGNVAALDELSKSKGEVAGYAAYDAAFILQLVAPKQSDAAFWRDVAERYGRAAKLLRDPAQKKAALERAKAAEEIAAALGGTGKKS